MTGIGFDLLATDGRARRGRVTTAHGTIETPAFMPVGTAATVKAMTTDAVASTGAEILLGNTYHLMLRPTAERVAQLGGLHRFMNWNKPILTDSGGFQVMSLSDLRTMSEEGVTFKSHLDGSRHHLTPERSIQIQHMLDSNITMCLDECTPFPATEAQAESSMRLSMRWARRSKDAFVERPGYGLFGIVQGSVYPDQRAESVAALTDIGFDGYAIGGLAVGEGQETMFRVLDFTEPLMVKDRPRYLMGVGRPSDLIGAVRRGVDMFDCVMPTRSGRTGQAFVRSGTINIRNARHAHDERPLDADCGCPACRSYSRGYLHHLFKADEMLGPMLLTWHNLHYYQDVMRTMRQAIEDGTFEEVAGAMEARLNEGDVEATADPIAKPGKPPKQGRPPKAGKESDPPKADTDTNPPKTGKESDPQAAERVAEDKTDD
ncbi:tRNA guanosine(34) transglycosylase Tgt [Azospirillum picis]|uniref:Queuine tRNA-ribosyltransferase n=1 Tax=Azospirillum picis TaxID=488438 RepID=A0ABU0MIS0_9PROT|nr:tRNA guanosine(34) transglycosylase Tgt [Azospirillum picis]MBP2299508.1 queuine tRNA-ribosyltransferase [Azospirillum picis]MDQ0533365.1 queuine tRNA-ribosyltransferase [Azospirillum picis]